MYNIWREHHEAVPESMLHLQLQASEMCQIWHLQEGSARQALVQRQEGGLCSVAVGRTVMTVQRGVLHMQVGREPVARAQQLQQLLCWRAPQAVVRNLQTSNITSLPWQDRLGPSQSPPHMCCGPDRCLRLMSAPCCCPAGLLNFSQLNHPAPAV